MKLKSRKAKVGLGLALVAVVALAVGLAIHRSDQREGGVPLASHSNQTTSEVGGSGIPPSQGLGDQSSATGPWQAPETQRMAQLLEQIARRANPLRNDYLNDRKAEYLQKKLAETTTISELLKLQREFAYQLLNSGATETAIRAFESLEHLFAQHDPKELAENWDLRRTLAVAYLRLGEQENCLENHTIDSCLLPIKGTGVHQLERGSRKAIALLNGLLAERPDDLGLRWLLNIAHMTLGEYPEAVPSQWLIPPKHFGSEYDIKRFVDVAPQTGLGVNELSGGAVLDDFTGDGNLDLVVSSIGLRDQLRFFVNQGDGSFSDKTLEAGLKGEVGGLNLVHADYDNNGFLDVYILRGAWFAREGRHPNSLLKNNGDGTFSDVTEAAGLLSRHPTQTAVWLDYNGDGWIDLYVGNETFGNDRHRCELFRNNGDGTFTECAVQFGIAKMGYVKAVISGDFNNDHRPDLYLSIAGKPNILYRNDGPAGAQGRPESPWQFTEVTAAAGVAEPINSFPGWFFDYDNDGWEDLFVSSYRLEDIGSVAASYLGLPFPGAYPRLYRNQGDGTFDNVTIEAGLKLPMHAMGSNFGDLDNDGWLDFYLGTGDPEMGTLVPNRMFRNANGHRFQDVTTSGGFGHLQKGHAVAFGDIDNDGDQDVFAEMGGAYTGDVYPNALFENPGHGNAWIKLKLEGVRSNRAAIGARIRIVLEMSNDTERVVHRTVGSGGSFGCSPFRQEIGLAAARSIRHVDITWPRTQTTQRFTNLQLNQSYRIREDASEARLMKLTAFKLGTDARHTHQH